eukprot:s1261_g3.t1
MSLATYGIPNNWLNLFIILEFGCSVAVIYHTALQHAFGMKALTLRQILAGSCLPLLWPKRSGSSSSGGEKLPDQRLRWHRQPVH